MFYVNLNNKNLKKGPTRIYRQSAKRMKRYTYFGMKQIQEEKKDTLISRESSLQNSLIANETTAKM